MVDIIEIDETYSDAFKQNHRTPFQKAFQYVASFPPALPAMFINMYSEENNVVLDPFCGKGTCPLQALAMDRDAIGNDMSMVAYTYAYSRIKHIPLDFALKAIDELIVETKKITVNPHEFEAMLSMYNFDTLTQILRTREFLNGKFDDVSMFLKAHICGILYGAGPEDLTTDLPGTFPMNLKNIKEYVDESGGKPIFKDLFSCLRSKIVKSMTDGVPRRRGKIFYGNSLDLGKKIDSNTIDLVCTSPPYINLIAYGEKTWVMQWFLNQDYREYDKKTRDVGSCSGNENEYFGLMRNVLKIMYGLLKDNTACVFVVGGSKREAEEKGILHIPMKFVKVGKEIGFDVDTIYTRAFKSSFRSMFEEKTRNKRGISYQDASIVFVKGEPTEFIPFNVALNYGLRNEADIDSLKNIDLSDVL